ncbi:hypothetical protein [Novispirillum itersonii]|uniref:Uncharacterized protein n=1 Tax=Novispirillum itersonii TaxID=189 RepID=A0A7W9ZF28_NOVIT|nr:hypothetical protein [Novispirillum itersonii]MBB6210326.1 hypothetical protein [Novispirillum itersonii]
MSNAVYAPVSTGSSVTCRDSEAMLDLARARLKGFRSLTSGLTADQKAVVFGDAGPEVAGGGNLR